MEQQQQEKPRVSYADFLKQVPEKREGTVASLIERFIKERSLPGRRPLGKSHFCVLRRLQREPIGAKVVASLKAVDYLEHAAARIAGGVKPCTVNQDMTYLTGLLRYAEDTWEVDGINLKVWKKAKRQLVREQLIGKGEKRKRLPLEEELARLRAYFEERDKKPRTKAKMVPVMDAEILTGRRISEIVRIERQHVNVEKRTCMVYDLKDSRGKGYHDSFALIEGAWELFEERLKLIPNEPTARLFPFNRQTCISNYVEAKNALGIKDLHMHDNRAKAFVRLLKKGYTRTQVQKGISLHKGDGKVLDEHYLRLTAEDLHDGPMGNQQGGIDVSRDEAARPAL